VQILHSQQTDIETQTPAEGLPCKAAFFIAMII